MNAFHDRVALVRSLYGDQAARLVERGWTVDAAIAHIDGTCDRTICGGDHSDVDANAVFADIERLANQAKAALADEREGDFTRAVNELAEHTDALRELVRRW
jgi:hypothetical protein